jgi:hypothetical protein
VGIIKNSNAAMCPEATATLLGAYSRYVFTTHYTGSGEPAPTSGEAMEGSRLQ